MLYIGLKFYAAPSPSPISDIEFKVLDLQILL